MKKILTELLNKIVQDYWIKVTTSRPSCTYYFGPFLTQKEAKSAQPGFIEDLATENAEGIKAEIGCFNPKELTVFNELNDDPHFTLFPQPRKFA